MKILFLFLVSYPSMAYMLPPSMAYTQLLLHPTQVKIGLSQFLHSGVKLGDYRYLAEKIRNYIDCNATKEALNASSIAITMRRLRGFFPAEPYAEMLGISREELQQFENGTLIPNRVVLEKAANSVFDEDIYNYHEQRGAEVNIRKQKAAFLQNGDKLMAAIKDAVTVEVFLLSFSKAMQDAEAGNSAREIETLEDALKSDYPDAPYTFAQLTQEAAPVMEKLRRDAAEVDVWHNEDALSLVLIGNSD